MGVVLQDQGPSAHIDKIGIEVSNLVAPAKRVGADVFAAALTRDGDGWDCDPSRVPTFHSDSGRRGSVLDIKPKDQIVLAENFSPQGKMGDRPVTIGRNPGLSGPLQG